MNYRRLGERTEWMASILGFGTMRLPLAGERPEQIAEAAATGMLEAAVASGITYIDTAYPYHGGESERWLGRALSTGLREQVILATKLPVWAVESKADCERVFAEQCERLQTERIDVYLLHNLHGGNWPKVRDLGVLAWLDELVADGRIGATGFSFHGEYPVFEEIVDAYPWTLAQIQYNYMNEDIQAGSAGLAYAARRGLGVVVMEPLLGGCLASPPPPMQAVWDRFPGVSPIETAFRWLWRDPAVSLVLSGMGSLAEIQENVGYAASGDACELSAAALQAIEEVKATYGEVNTIPCTRCGYCLPCPHGVDIPRNFQLYNDAQLFAGNQALLNRVLFSQMEAANAHSCIGCRQCEERCPQHIEISSALATVRTELG